MLSADRLNVLIVSIEVAAVWYARTASNSYPKKWLQ